MQAPNVTSGGLVGHVMLLQVRVAMQCMSFSCCSTTLYKLDGAAAARPAVKAREILQAQQFCLLSGICNLSSPTS